MSTRITASAETLLEQASMTATTYFKQAIGRIDAEFGSGYAAKHPELVGAFMQTAASDLQTATLTQAIQELTLGLSNR